MPRALVLCEYPSMHGGERSLLAMLDGAAGTDWHWTIAAPPSGPLAQAIRGRGLPLVPLALQDTTGRRFAPDVCRRQLDAVLAAQRPSLVHANSLSMSRLVGPVAAGRNVPGLGHLRDIMRVSAATIRDLNCLPRLLAVSHATRDWYLSLGLDGSRTHVVYNGVDLARFQPARPTGFLHTQLGLPPDALLLGVIGQIGIRKGLDVALEALRILRRDLPTVHLAIVGGRHSQKAESVEFEAQLRNRGESAELAGQCHFLGVRDDVARLLPELTVLVHAARQEPLGRVLLEAAACGIPVVATGVGGTREIFPEEAQAAVITAPDDPRALAEAIRRLVGDPPGRAEIGRRARARAEAAFDARQAAENLLTHYEALVEPDSHVAQ
jgi:glycosyltransferase involved in cell wall biosynthesis